MVYRQGIRLGLLVSALLILSACASHRVATAPAQPAPRAPGAPAAPSAPGPVAVGYEETGEASWYGNPYHGRRAASGEVYDMNQMTAAHRTLPFGTRIRVQSLVDGSSVEVRINDRGPFKDEDKRILDLSFAAGKLLGVIGPGVIPIRLRVVSLGGPPTAAAPPAAPASAPPAARTIASPPGSAGPPATAATVSTPPPIATPPAVTPASSQTPVSPPAQVIAPVGAEASTPPATTAARAEPVARAEPRAEPVPRLEPPPRPSSGPRAEGWSVQLAAYGSEAPAVSLRNSLARSWPDARVQRAEVGGRLLWRVRVGNYATRHEADEAVKRLASSGYRAMVVDAASP
jgi:rare lipoprotein A